MDAKSEPDSYSEQKDSKGSKGVKEGKGGGSDAVVLVDVQRIHVESAPEPLTDPLDLDVDFTVDRYVADAVWEIKVVFRVLRQLITLMFSIWLIAFVRGT